jgi:hypothetical protein
VAASLLKPKFVFYNLSIQFTVLVSPTEYFRDGQMHVCANFQGIKWDFENNYRVETSNKILKLFTRIPQRLIDLPHVDEELVNVANDHDTITSAQREMDMIYCQFDKDASCSSI